MLLAKQRFWRRRFNFNIFILIFSFQLKIGDNMVNYVYGALLLHSAGKKINEDNIKKVIEATGEKPDEAKIKALVSALENVNIEEAISKATAMPTAPVEKEKKEEKKEKEEEELEKKAEEAVEGLSALFG